MDAINDELNGDVAVFYLNNSKTTKALQRTGNPIPSGLSNLDGFIHSITDPGPPVKVYARYPNISNPIDMNADADLRQRRKKVAIPGSGVLGANDPLSGAGTATIESVADAVRIVKQCDAEYTGDKETGIGGINHGREVDYRGDRRISQTVSGKQTETDV